MYSRESGGERGDKDSYDNKQSMDDDDSYGSYSEKKWKHWKPPKKPPHNQKSEKIQKASSDFQKTTWELPEIEFYKKIRLKKETFLFLENLIEKDPVFLNDSKNAQTDVRFQLFVALYRLGSSEKKTSISRIAEETGKANGTVSLYTERVLKALNNISRSYISWPNNDERQLLSKGFESKYSVPNIIGLCSPVEIYFTQRPAIDPLSYQFSGEKNSTSYGVSSLMVCDDKYFIRYLGTFSPGSQSLEFLWESTPMSINPERYFKENECISSAFVQDYPHVTGLRFPEQSENNAAINSNILKMQQVTNKTIYLWKSRWGSLLQMKKQLKKSEDASKVESWIRATAVLHNIACEMEPEWIQDDSERFEDFV
ncbi:hypothetical protein AYI68_g1588 [Smittium mucronatum]|uniref:DDE Tnp4 domain-containing protein n=1 Tax=Smittium mucronatum TaxID=133383 RepID=A0A1R0H4V1_9FUNG|nr:hypothetical protein AYI68_g1588 [Smittium mucronatum]